MSHDQLSRKHPKHNGVENDETKPFKCINQSDLSKSSKFKCNLCTEMFSSESNLMENKISVKIGILLP